MRTRQTSTVQHKRFTLWALLLIVAVVIAILHTTRVTGSSVPAESTIDQQTADASNISGSRSAYIAGTNSGDRVIVFDTTQIKTTRRPGIADVSLVGTTARDCKMQPSAPVNLARCV